MMMMVMMEAEEEEMGSKASRGVVLRIGRVPANRKEEKENCKGAVMPSGRSSKPAFCAENKDSGVEYEIVEDEIKHEELGGVVFELEIVDPIPGGAQLP
ncbi:hypothetical protein NL676_005872 [Syzygium grande]|nr:hypothetical protein NL676_005872 [Syzygium grande]